MRNIFCFFISITILSFSQSSYQFAKLKYSGGGDWYANPSSLKNLAIFCNKNLNMNIDENFDVVEPSSNKIFEYPYIYMTGHGNVSFSDMDIENLKKYLTGGGFLHIDDNYGMNKFIRTEIKKIFPESDFVEIPYNHNIYNNIYKFQNGLPKIHEHDNKPPQALAIFENDRIVILYTFETDLGDGWEDATVHNNNEEKRDLALKMGVNIIYFALTQ